MLCRDMGNFILTAQMDICFKSPDIMILMTYCFHCSYFSNIAFKIVLLFIIKITLQTISLGTLGATKTQISHIRQMIVSKPQSFIAYTCVCEVRLSLYVSCGRQGTAEQSGGGFRGGHQLAILQFLCDDYSLARL